MTTPIPLLSAHSSTYTMPRKIIIDTEYAVSDMESDCSPGVDDVLAILLALASVSLVFLQCRSRS